jgi:hypothetical protein
MANDVAKVLRDLFQNITIIAQTAQIAQVSSVMVNHFI